MFPDPDITRYSLTDDDILAINEMMDITYGYHLKCYTDHGEHATKSFFVFAVNPRNNTWYTGQGETICEAVDSWFEQVAKRAIPLRRWDVAVVRLENKHPKEQFFQQYLPGLAPHHSSGF